MTRHQRRKAAKARTLAAQRKAIVRDNLSQPVVREHIRGAQISTVYSGGQDRARGFGVVPMTHKVQRVISHKPYAASLGSGAYRKVIRREGDKLVTRTHSVQGCGWRVD